MKIVIRKLRVGICNHC